MKKSLTLVFLAIILAFFSCSSDLNVNEEPKNNSFRQFLEKFRTLQLPLTFSGRLGASAAEGAQNLPAFDAKSADTLFVSDGPGTIYYGMLPDTTDYYGLVLFLVVWKASPW